MTEKEMNMAILEKIYEIAVVVWAKLTKKVDFGSYTAKEVHKQMDKAFIFEDEQEANETYNITVGSFACSFTAASVFHYAAVFERLAGIGKDARQFVYEEAGDTLGKITFEVSKEIQDLCKFVGNNPLRPVMSYIYLDTENKMLVATDGHKLRCYPVNVKEQAGEMDGLFIDSKKFAAMCRKMKKGAAYEVTGERVAISGKEYNIISFGGVASNVEDIYNFPNWKPCVPMVSDDLKICLGKSWKEIKSFVKKSSGENTYISGVCGCDYIMLESGANELRVSIENTLKCGFKILVKNASLLCCDSVDTLYPGKADDEPICGTGKSGGVFLLMPCYIEDSQHEEFCGTNNITFDIDLLAVLTDQDAQGTEVATVEEAPTEMVKVEVTVKETIEAGTEAAGKESFRSAENVETIFRVAIPCVSVVYVPTVFVSATCAPPPSSWLSDRMPHRSPALTTTKGARLRRRVAFSIHAPPCAGWFGEVKGNSSIC